MALNGFKTLHMGSTAIGDFPNIENSKATIRKNVIEESVVVVKLRKMMVVILGVSLVVYEIADGLTWQRTKRRVNDMIMIKV
jgi:hypothetical protein